MQLGRAPSRAARERTDPMLRSRRPMRLRRGSQSNSGPPDLSQTILLGARLKPSSIIDDEGGMWLRMADMGAELESRDRHAPRSRAA